MFLQYRCDDEGSTRGLARLADIKLNGTIMDRMKAEVDCLPGTAEGLSCGMGSGRLMPPRLRRRGHIGLRLRDGDFTSTSRRKSSAQPSVLLGKLPGSDAIGFTI